MTLGTKCTIPTSHHSEEEKKAAIDTAEKSEDNEVLIATVDTAARLQLSSAWTSVFQLCYPSKPAKLAAVMAQLPRAAWRVLVGDEPYTSYEEAQMWSAYRTTRVSRGASEWDIIREFEAIRVAWQQPSNRWVWSVLTFPLAQYDSEITRALGKVTTHLVAATELQADAIADQKWSASEFLAIIAHLVQMSD